MPNDGPTRCITQAHGLLNGSPRRQPHSDPGNRGVPRARAIEDLDRNGGNIHETRG